MSPPARAEQPASTAAAPTFDAAFDAAFGRSPEIVWHAPGRVNVIGEHTDYNDGFVLPIAIPAGVDAAVARRTDGVVVIESAQAPEPRVELRIADLVPGQVEGWAAYPAGVAWALRELGAPIAGFELHLSSDLPQGAGLSSSAAVTCSVAAALAEVHGLTLSRLELIDVARRAENDFVGVPTGTLDQSASLLAQAGHALFLDTRDFSHRQVPFELEAVGLDLLIINTNAPRRLVDSAYAERRDSCRQAALRLGVTALRDVAIAELGPALDRLDDEVLVRRARHVVTENHRVEEVVAVLDAGIDPRAIGPLLTASHESLRDDFEVTVTQLDVAVQTALDAGAHGARMTGGGFGGCIIALVDRQQTTTVSEAVATAFDANGFASPTTWIVHAAQGANRKE